MRTARLNTTRFSEVDFGSGAQVSSFVRAAWMRRIAYRGNEERDWYCALAFFRGDQWIEWNDSLGVVAATFAKKNPDRARYIVNVLLPAVQRERARILSLQPRWKAVPKTEDYDEIAAARLGTRVLRSQFEQQRMLRTIDDLVGWAAITGNAFLRCLWDPSAGPESGFESLGIQDPGFASQISELAGGALGGGGTMGDIAIECRPPTAILWDSTYEFEKSPWMIDAEVMSVSEARMLYNDGSIKPEPALMSQVAARSLSSGRDFALDISDSVVRFLLFTRPMVGFPRGFQAEVVGSRVQAMGPSKLPFRRYPYAHVREVVDPERPFGTSRLRQAVSVQAAFNVARSSSVHEAARWARPKYARIRGGGYTDADLSDPSRDSFSVTSPTLLPRVLERPQSPAWVESQPSRIFDELTMVIAQNEATQGRQPGSVRSSVGIQDLREADAAVSASFVRDVRDALSLVGSMSLAFMQRFYKEDRIIASFGEEAGTESLIVSGDRLRGSQFGVPGSDLPTVVVEVVSGQPMTSFGKEERAVRLVQAGILHPERDRDTLHRLVEIDQIPEYRESEDVLETANARRENARIARGERVTISPSDNHAIHLQVMRAFQQSPQYRYLSPIAQAIYEAHRQEHALGLQRELRNRLAINNGPV